MDHGFPRDHGSSEDVKMLKIELKIFQQLHLLIYILTIGGIGRSASPLRSAYAVLYHNLLTCDFSRLQLPPRLPSVSWEALVRKVLLWGRRLFQLVAVEGSALTTVVVEL